MIKKNFLLFLFLLFFFVIVYFSGGFRTKFTNKAIDNFEFVEATLLSMGLTVRVVTQREMQRGEARRMKVRERGRRE